MKILLVNTYFFLYGGAERCFFNTTELLKEQGHEVIHFAMQHPRNVESPYSKYFVSYFPSLNELNLFNKIKYLFRFFYNFEAKHKFRKLLRETKPDIIHIHIIDYKISHSIISEAKRQKIPIVMTLHDLRILCPQIVFLSEGRICEECIDGSFRHCIKNRCIEGNLLKSLFLTFYYYFNNKVVKSLENIDLFISPSLFLMNKIKTSKTFRSTNIKCLPHFINFHNFNPNFEYTERSIIYFGRLSKEKGIDSLLESVKGLDVHLKIAGKGREEKKLMEKVKNENIENVTFLGYLEPMELQQEISNSMFSVAPSLCFESFGYSIIESFCLGKTVIASNIGAFSELVKDKSNGLLFEPGDVRQLRDKIKFLTNNSESRIKFGKNAREWVKNNLNQDKFYKTMINEYNNLIKNSFHE